MAKFWNMNHDADEGYLTLFGDISDVSWFGDEVTPRLFKQELDDMGDISLLNVSINSGGGDVFAGQAIYNMIKNHKAKVVVRVEGLAASIASVIAMAGDEIIMPENALLMIHEAWSGVVGNKRDMRKMAETLDTIDGTIRAIYASKTGLGMDKLATMMEAETWITAKEAFDMGFATEVEANKQIAAKFDGKTAVINGVTVDIEKYKNAANVFDGAVSDTEPEAAVEAEEIIDHCNGEEIQPVDDNKEERINALKRLATII